ncbi:hypothetical protein, partial [Mesorhizobium sp.]|uniref:hypothetical protein n=1 Tax=Mesorhizobium sp. TaxID=1871066 RepID=UPI00345DC4B5
MADGGASGGAGRGRQDKGTASRRRLNLCLHIVFPGGCRRCQEGLTCKCLILLDMSGRLALRMTSSGRSSAKSGRAARRPANAMPARFVRRSTGLAAGRNAVVASQEAGQGAAG